VKPFLSNSKERAQLIRQMLEIGLEESDIEETFTFHDSEKAKPAGVTLLHQPSGIIVKCRATTDQERNRFLARRVLVDKIERYQKYNTYQNYSGGSSRDRSMTLIIALILMATAAFLIIYFFKT
jgi:hypothetical protein